jgi:hypothetical protein
MKLLPTLVLVTALGFGAAGAATAYRLAAPAESPASARTAVVVPAAEPAARAPRPAHVFRWAPCPRGTVLKGKTCVRTVLHRIPRTVSVPAPAPAPVPVAAPAPAAPATTHSGTRPGAHEADHVEHQDDGEHEHEHEDDGGGEHEDD